MSLHRRVRRPRHRGGDARTERGFLLVWLSIMMVVLLATAGFAVDLGFWFREARNTQKAADAAALAGVVQRRSWNNLSAVPVSLKDTVLDAASANGADLSVDVVDTTPQGLFYDRHGTQLPTNQLRVKITRNAPAFFSKLLGIGDRTVVKEAIAEYEPPPPLGSPSNVLGNDGGEPDYNQLAPADRLGQSLWLDVHGHRTPAINGDQYQSGRCSGYQYPGPSVASVDPCQGTTDNQSFTSGFLGSKPGAEGYYYKIEVKNPVVGTPVEVQVFDPALGWVRSDCRDASLTAPFNDPGTQTWANFIPGLNMAGMQAAWWGQIVVENWQGSPAAVAPHAIDLLLHPPPNPGIWGTGQQLGRYNYWRMLVNYHVTIADLLDIQTRYAAGPANPTCAGDELWYPNMCWDAFLCFIAGLLAGGGGGGGGIPWGGGTAEGPTRLEPIPAPDAGGTDVRTVPLDRPGSGRPKAQTVANFNGFDGIAETQYTLLAPGPGDSMTDYRSWDTVCQDTYGWWNFMAMPDGGSTYWHQFLFNGDLVYPNWPNFLGIVFGNLPIGKDIGSNNFSTTRVQDMGHRFRDTFRKWVSLNNGACHPSIQSNWITGDHAELVMRVRTNTRDNSFDDPTGGQSDTCNPTCGYGANRFAIRSRSGSSPVEVYADQKMAIMGNFATGAGQFWFTEVNETPGRARLLDVAFYDPGDIAVCTDANGDGAPDSTLDTDCDRAGGSGLGAGFAATLKVLDPYGQPFSTCKVWTYSIAGEPPDGPGNIKSPCQITDVDTRYNAKILMMKIPIPASYTCNPSKPVTPVDLRCWTKLQFDYPSTPAGTALRPEDVTSWTATFEGVPVHLVE